jgi:hypothetical protein
MMQGFAEQGASDAQFTKTAEVVDKQISSQPLTTPRTTALCGRQEAWLLTKAEAVSIIAGSPLNQVPGTKKTAKIC